MAIAHAFLYPLVLTGLGVQAGDTELMAVAAASVLTDTLARGTLSQDFSFFFFPVTSHLYK